MITATNMCYFELHYKGNSCGKCGSGSLEIGSCPAHKNGGSYGFDHSFYFCQIGTSGTSKGMNN